MITATRLRVRVQKSISVLRDWTEKFSITTLSAEIGRLTADRDWIAVLLKRLHEILDLVADAKKWMIVDPEMDSGTLDRPKGKTHLHGPQIRPFQ